MKKFKVRLTMLEWFSLVLISLILVGCIVLAVYLLEPAKEPEKESVFFESTYDVIDRDIEFDKSIRKLEKDEVVPEFEVIDDAYTMKEIGRCRLTVYTPSETSWGYATATGKTSMHLMTCAVDPSIIPYGSNVIITDKDGEEWRFKAIDCGNFSGNWIDIFFEGTEKHGIEWLDEVFGGDFGDVRIEVPVK